MMRQATPVGSTYAALQPSPAVISSSFGGVSPAPLVQYAARQQPLQVQQLPFQQHQSLQQSLQQPQMLQVQQQLQAPRPQAQWQQAQQAGPKAPVVAPGVGLPASPKAKAASLGLAPAVITPRTIASGGQAMVVPAAMVQQVQGLEQRLRELEDIVERKDEEIKELKATLARAGVKPERHKARPSPVKSSGVGGFQKLAGSKPQRRYVMAEQNDPVDARLEEFYNSTGSAVQFQRINHGFYRFGETTVELSIINHKLMARTEDGWNRSKFGPIEKFLMYYENIEREKAGIIPDS